MKRVQAVRIVFASALLLASLVAVACQGHAPTSQNQPNTPTATSGAIDATALLETRCSQCHTLDRVKQAHKTQAEWEATVRRMRARGAVLSEAEAKTLIDHLAETYR